MDDVRLVVAQQGGDFFSAGGDHGYLVVERHGEAGEGVAPDFGLVVDFVLRVLGQDELHAVAVADEVVHQSAESA